MNGSEWVWTLIELSANLFELLIIQMLFEHLFGAKAMMRKIAIPLTLVLTGVVYLFNHLNIPVLATVAFFFMIFYLLAHFLYEGAWQNKLLILLVYFIAWGGSEIGSLFALSLVFGSTESFAQPTVERLVAIVISKILLFIIMRAIIRIRLNKYLRIPFKYFLGLMIFPVASMMNITLLSRVWINAHPSADSSFVIFAALASVSLMFANLFVFMLFDRVSDAAKTKSQVLLLEKQISYERKFLDNAQSRYDDLRRMAHDLNQILTPLAIYAEAGELDKIQEAVRASRQRVDQNQIAIDSGNRFIDALLTEKMADAGKKGIQIQREIHSLSENLPVPPEALSVLLGNALDNAIEACSRIPDAPRIIRLMMRQEKGMFQMMIQNRFAVDPVVNHGVFLSTKTDPLNHGFGLNSIEQIVEQYHGTMSIDTNNHQFTMTIFFAI